MADTTKPKAVETVLVLIERDYWPKSTPPEDHLEGEEYRIRAGETVDLPTLEAIDVIEAGIGKRVRASDALKA